MKRSVLILLTLFLLISAALFGAKYNLAQEFEDIDRTNPYYAFEQINQPIFTHVKILGGNKRHITIEHGDENKLYIGKTIAEKLNYKVSSDTLIISFATDLTDDNSARKGQWGSKKHSSLIIQGNHIKSLYAKDASISIVLENTTHFSSQIEGYTNLTIEDSFGELDKLNIVASNKSNLRINQGGNNLNLSYFNIELHEECTAELYLVNSDSTIIDLDTNSRISADANFFK